MKIVSFSSPSLLEDLQYGEVIAFPTETVYGLGINWDEPQAFLKLTSIKQRAINKPISIMCGKKFDLSKFFVIDDKTKRIIDKFLPGPLTILLKIRKNVPWQTHLGSGVVGVRIPDSEELLRFLDSNNKPLQVTSANIANEPALSDFSEVYKVFCNQPLISSIVKGECRSSIPTTIVSAIDGKLKLIRQGEIKFEYIYKIYNLEGI